MSQLPPNPYGPPQHGGRPRHEHGPGIPPARAHAAPPAAPPAPAQPARRRRWPRVVGGVVGAFVLLLVIGGIMGGNSDRPAGSSTSSAPAAAAPAEVGSTGTDTITYEVTGDGVSKANNITYVKDSNFGMQQANGERLPWSADVAMDAGLFDLQPMTLTAQSGSGRGGSITCRILRNGVEVTSSTSSGPYAVVTCSGGLR